jgi:CheY-like chemotaxis protein
MSGLEATVKIKMDPEAQRIQIIALTSHAMDADGERALESGCDNFVTKPIGEEKLIGIINLFQYKVFSYKLLFGLRPFFKREKNKPQIRGTEAL